MATLAEVNVRIGARIEGLQKGLRNAERSMQRSGRKLTALGNSLSTTFSLPIIGAGVAAAKLSSDFESAMTKINTLVGVPDATLNTFKDSIASLSGTLASSQRDLADTLFVITSAGQKGTGALTTLEQASKAAAIGMGDAKEVARAATAATAAYGAENLSSAAAVDKFTAIVREGNLEASELAPSLGKVLPIAAQLGVSLDEVGANIAVFTRLGVPASEAVSAVRGTLSALIKPSKEAAEEMARIGTSAEELRKSVKDRGLAATLQDLTKAYGGNVAGLVKLFPRVEALTNVLGTAGAQGEEYEKVLQSITNSQGLVDKAFDKTSKGPAFQFKQALVSAQNAGIAFGAVILPVVTDLLQNITPLIQSFGNLDESTKRIIVTGAGVLAALGPVIKVFGTLKLATASFIGVTGQLVGVMKTVGAAFFKLTAVMAANPFVAAAIAIAALGAAIYVATQRTDGLAAAQDTLATAQSNIAKEFDATSRQGAKYFEVLKSVNSTTEERQAAIAKLQSIYPDFIKNVNLEGASLEDLADFQRQANVELQKSLAIKAKDVALQDVRNKLIDKQLRLTKLEQNGASELSFFEQLDGLGGLNPIDTTIDKTKKEIAALNAELVETEKLFDITFGLTKRRGGGRSNPNFGAATSSTDSATPTNRGGSSLTIDTSAIASVTTATEVLTEKNDELTAAFKRRAEAIARNNEVLPQLVAEDTQAIATNEALAASFEASQESIIKRAQAYDLQIQKVIEFNQAIDGIVESGIEGALTGIAESAGNAISGVGERTSFLGSVLESVASVMAQLGKLAIGAGIAIGGIRTALQSLNPVVAIAGGAALIALSKVVKNKAANLAPKLAQGGLAFGETLATVGDNPNARIDPEVIAPLSKLKEFIQPANDFAFGDVQFRIQGTDLLAVMEKGERARTARRGY